MSWGNVRHPYVFASRRGWWPERPPTPLNEWPGWYARQNVYASATGVGTPGSLVAVEGILAPATGIGTPSALAVADLFGQAVASGAPGATVVAQLAAAAVGVGTGDALAAQATLADVLGIGLPDAQTVARLIAATATGDGIAAADARAQLLASAAGVGTAAGEAYPGVVEAAADAFGAGTPAAELVVRLVTAAAAGSGTSDATLVIREALAAAAGIGTPAGAAAQHAEALAAAAGIGSPWADLSVPLTGAASGTGTPASSNIIEIAAAATGSGLSSATLGVASVLGSATASGTAAASIVPKPAADATGTGTPAGSAVDVTPAIPPKPTFVGAAAGAGTSIAIPTHQVGDTIVVFAYNNIGTIPTAPAAGGTVPAWTTFDPTTGNVNAARLGMFRATATTTTTGTWTNASGMVVIVFRGVSSTVALGGHAVTTATAATSTAPAVTLDRTDDTSVLIHFHAARAVNGNWLGAPAGYTRRAAFQTGFNGSGMVVNTKDSTTTDGSVSQGNTIGAGDLGASVELRAY